MTRVIGLPGEMLVFFPGAGTDPGPALGSRRFSSPTGHPRRPRAGFAPQRISLLKLDVEGYEPQVLAGAAGLLAAQAIDLVYVEAGMDPDGAQQSYYREIEDRLRGHGYRLFRIYEQMHEWPEDSPLLRRVNLAFMSTDFAQRHPFRLTRELAALRQAQAAPLEAELAGRDRALPFAEAKAGAAAGNKAPAARRLEARLAAREAALAAARESLGTAEAALKAPHPLHRRQVRGDGRPDRRLRKVKARGRRRGWSGAKPSSASWRS